MARKQNRRGASTSSSNNRRNAARRRRAEKEVTPFSVEQLEQRILLSYSYALAGSTATITGDDTTLVIDVNGGNLEHIDNGVPSLDWNSGLAGIQTLAAAGGSTVNFNPTVGSGSFQLGNATTPASSLLAQFNVAEPVGNTAAVTIDDSAIAAVTTYTIDLSPGTITATGIKYNEFFSTAPISGGVTLKGSSGADTYNVLSTVIPPSEPVAIDAGSSSDTVNVLAVGSGGLTVNGGGGGDIVTVGSQAGISGFNTDNSDLFGIVGTVNVNNTGAGTLNVDESASTSADTVLVTNGQISSAIVPFTVNYDSTLALVQLATGSNGDTVNVTSTLGTATTNIFANSGTDTYNITGTGLAGTNNFYGGNDNDVFNVNSTPVALGVTVNLDGGAPNVPLAAGNPGDILYYNGPGSITEIGVGSGFITSLAPSGPFANVNFTTMEAVVPTNPGFSIVLTPGGWVVTVTGDQGFPQDDSFTLSTQPVAGQTYVAADMNGVEGFVGIQSDVHQIFINGGLGNDTLTVDSTAGPVLPTLIPGNDPEIFYDGGLGFDSLTLTGGTATADTYTAGPQNGSGISSLTFGGLGTQTVNFQNLEPVYDLVAGPLVVIGTPADNAINYTEGINNVTLVADPTFGMVTIDNQEFIDFGPLKTNLTIDAGPGSDEINLNNPNNPFTPAGAATITVIGGDPTGSDTLIVNGRVNAVDAFTYTPATTTGDTGSVAITGLPTVNFSTIEQLVIDGQNTGPGGAADTLTINTANLSAGLTEILTPGSTFDSGSVDFRDRPGGVNPIGVPVAFEALGVGSSLTFADVGRFDNLVYNGTALNDTFSVNATGQVNLNDQIVVNTNAVINTLTLVGMGGQNTFNIAANNLPFIRVQGGDSTTTLTGDGTAVTATMDTNAQDVTVTGGGLGSVTLTAVDLVKVINSAGAAAGVIVDGTALNDSFGVTQVDATHTTFTLAGLNTTLIANAGAGALTLDPAGGNNSVTYTAPATTNTIIDPTAATVTTTGFKALTLIPADVQSLHVTGEHGTFTVSTPVPATMSLAVDGTVGSGSVLTVDTSGPTAVVQGSSGDAGAVTSGTSKVNYAGMVQVVLTGAATPADTLTVFGTSGNDAINQAAIVVTVNDGAPVFFSGYTGLNIFGQAGDDVINVNPATLPGAILAFNVDGGDPTASDKVIVNGSGAAETILFTPTGAEAAGVKVGAFTTANITATELVEIVGAGNDNLQVTTPAATPLAYNPGATRDSGSVQAGSLVPMSFQNLGTASTVTLSDAGGPLTYNGTAGNDLFTVAAAGAITLNSQLVVTTVGVTGLTLNGLAGNNTFDIAGGAAFPYATVTVDPSGFNVVNLTGDGLAPVVLNNLGGVTPSVTGGGLGAVSLTGVDVLNLSAGGAAASVLGTAGPDVWSATPTGANAATIQAAGFTPLTYLTAAASLLLNPIGGGDQVTVNGTTGPDTIGVLNNAVTTTVTVDAFLPVGVSTASLGTTGALWVSGGTGDDTFNVSGTNGPALVVDGGLPTASDRLNITNTNVGPTTIKVSTVPGSGVIITPDYVPTNSITYVGIEAFFVTGPAGGTLTVDGTNADNAIDYVEGVNPGTLLVDPAYGRVLVDNQSPFDFTNITTLVINGLGGDDVINLNNPHTPTLLTGITVNGGDPTASDKVIVNGTGAAETINFAPTFGTDDGATVTVGGLPPVTITTTELIDIVGAGADNLQVTPPVVSLTTLTPGATVDSGSVQVGSFVPMTFRNLGGASTVTMNDVAGSSLAYNGTASDDTFTVSAAGIITLNSQLPVTPVGVIAVTLNGLDGANTFNVTAGFAYGLTLDPSGYSLTNFVGTGAAATAVMDRTTLLTTITGGGLILPLIVPDFSLINLDNSAGAAAGVTVDGTAVNDAFGVSPVSAGLTGFTLAGFNSILNVATGGGPLTLDPLGGVNSVTYTGTAGDLVAVNWTTNQLASITYGPLNLVSADLQSLRVIGAGDGFFVTGAEPAGMLLTIDGVVGTGSTLSVTTAGGTTVTPGATSDAGRVTSVTNGTVNYVGIEAVSLTGAGAEALTIDGTNAGDSIDQAGNIVTVNNGATIAFPGGYTTLNLNGLAGDDVINVNPTSLAGIATFNVDGGSPTASDKVVVNGTAVGVDTISYNPTGANSAGVTVNGLLVGVTNTELVVIDGLGTTTTGDLLTVTTGANVNTFNYTPGATPDSGSFQVASLLPMSYTNLGDAGEAVTVVGGLGSTLVYNGTVNNDAFAVTNVVANGKVALATGGTTYLPIETSPNVTKLVINGIGGNDTFAVTNGNPYASIALNGGSSLNDVATLNGTGADITATLDAGNLNVNVTGGGLTTAVAGITLSGVELVNLNAATNNIRVNSAGGSNTVMTVNPINLTTDSVSISGLNTVINANVAAAPGSTLTVGRPGGTQDVAVNGTNGADAGITVALAALATQVTVPGFLPVNVATAQTSTLQVNGLAGADSFTVTGNAGPNLVIDGGSPTSGFGANLDTLNLTTAGTATVIPGLDGGSGQVNSAVNGTVNYVGIEKVALTGAVGTTLVIDGTTGNDAIDQTGNTVTVNNGAVIDFSAGAYNELDINALAGDDVINVNPAGLAAAILTFRVDGGSPTASDKVIVNATGAINFAPLGPAAADVTAGIVTHITNTELVVINGQPGPDGLTVTAPAAALVTYTPGVSVDSGSVQVNSLVPMSFENLGAAGTVTVSDAGGTLVYNGTASDDTFGVTGAGVITLVGKQLPVTPVGLANVTLNGLAGDDIFNVTAGSAYALTLSGGDPSASDVANLSGAAGAVAVTLGNTTTPTDTTVSGYGGLISLQGVEVLNANANNHAVSIVGTTASESLAFTPTGVSAGTVTQNGLNLAVNVSGVLGALAIDAGINGSNTVTVNGTAGNDIVTVVRGSPSTTVQVGALLAASVLSADAANLVVAAGAGDDTINVSGTGGPASLTVDGGLPTASDTLSITNAANGTTEVKPGSTPDSGVIVAADGSTTSFLGIERVSVTGLAPAAANTLVIDGTTGSDLIRLFNAGSNTAQVNDHAPVTFTTFGAVTLDGISGNDSYIVSPTALVTVTGVTVTGHLTTGTAAVTVNGSLLSENIVTTLTASGVNDTVAGLGALVTLNNPSSIAINGFGGNDNLSVTTPITQLITYTPGVTVDSASMQVGSLAPVSFSNLGSAGTVTLTDAGGSLAYNGTATDDTFTVTALNVVTLNSQLTVTTSGITGLRLNGLDGNNTFNLTGGYAYTTVTLDPSGSNVANLTGNGINPVALNNLGGTTANVTGGGLGTVSLSGVGVLNLNAATTATTVNGTAGPDNLSVTPTGANAATIQAAGFWPVTNLTNATSLTVDPAGGSDLLSVYATQAGEAITVNGTTSTVTVAGLLPVVYSVNTESVSVYGQDGSDTFTVTPSATVPFFIDGGNPIGVLPGDKLVINAGGSTTTFFPGPESDEGGFAFTAPVEQAVSFDHIESVTVLGAPIANILGTSENDQITITADSTDAGTDGVQDFTAEVSDWPTILFINTAAVNVFAGAGDDLIVVHAPAANSANWNVTVGIDGGSPGASDKLVVETPGNQAATYTPTGPTAGTLAVTGVFPTMTIANVEEFIYDGQGTDGLTVSGAGTFNLTPASVDSGQLALVSGTTQFLPAGYEEIGSLTANGTGGADFLVYNGTANNDAFTVGATTGTVSLFNNGGSLVYIPVLQTGVENLTLNALGGDDTFSVVGPQLFTTIQLAGGDPSASDVATLTGSGAGAVATMNSLTGQTTVSGGGLGLVTLSGVELVNLDNSAGAAVGVTVFGTAVNDAFGVSQVTTTQTAFTLAGLNTTLVANTGAGALTLDPLGGTDTITVNGTAGSDTGLVNGIVATGVALNPTVQVGAFKTLTLVTASTESLVIAGGAGDDTLTVNSTATPFLIPVVFDGGLGADSLVLTGGTATADTFTPGPQLGSGLSTITFAAGTQVVNFVNLEPVTDTVISPTLIVNGTNANNAIDYTAGATVALGRVSVDGQEFIDFNNKTQLTINGLGGDDVINLNNPNTPTGMSTTVGTPGITVNGGDPTASDILVANGTAGADSINFSPTSPSAGTITGAGPVTIVFATTEQVAINGQGGNDTLTVTTPAGANTINYTPGVAPDAGSVQVDSLVPMSFLNIGAAGTVAMADAAPARSDTLVYKGTTANDAFAILANGNITLAGHVTVTSTGANAGLTNVTINGIDGNDTFAVTNGNPYANIVLNGGPSSNDVATLTGSGAAAVATMNSSTEVTTVTGGGLATTAVTLSGVELVNLDNSAVATGSVEVDGTAVNDAFNVSQVDATHTAFTLAGFNTTLNATIGSGVAAVLSLDAKAGTNSVTVNGTAAGDTINVVNGATVTTSTVAVVGFQKLTLTTADTQSLVVAAGTGDDTINVSGTGGPALTVNGGLPTASDTLNITNTNHGTTTVKPGETPDSGTIATPDYAVPVSFLGIERITLTGVLPVSGPLTDALVMDGTIGSDLMSLYNTGGGNTALVNDHAPVIFSNFGPVTLDGIGGNDTFNVSPVGLVGVTSIKVTGHAETGGTAAAIVNGSSSADTITVTATSETTATVAITGSAPVTIDPVSSLKINALGGNDSITVTDGTPGLTGPTPLSAPITLNGGAGNDLFKIGTYTGELNIDGGPTSISGAPIAVGTPPTLVRGDTIDFSGAPGDGAGFGVTVDLDLINYAQTVDPNGETVNLLRPIANFVGSSFDDKVSVDASPTPRFVNGGLPNKPTSPDFSATPTPLVTDVAITGAAGQFGTALDGHYLNHGLMLNGQPIYVDVADVSNTLFYNGTQWELDAAGVQEYLATVAGVTLPKTLANVGNPGFTGTVSAPAPLSASAPNQLAPIPPGDELIVNGEQQFVTITHTNVDSGKVSAFSFAPITFTQIEKIVVENALGTTSTSTGVGTGATPTYTAAVPYATSGRPVSEAVGDVNGDGFLDMVVASIAPNGRPVVDVLLSNNGNGTFLPAQTLNVLTNNAIGGTQAVKLVDLNGDGHLDIVTINMNSTVSVLAGTGAGSNTVALDFATPLLFNMVTLPFVNFARNPIAMAVGDLDNDGLQDLVVANYGSATVTVLHNTSTLSTISFGTPLTYKSGGSYTSDVALMDVNKDGLLDILAVNRGSWTMTELLNSSITPGVFGPVNPVYFGLPRIPTSLSLPGSTIKFKSPVFSIQSQDNAGAYLDINQDGNPDVLLSTLNGSAILGLLGNGSGGFTVQPQAVYTGTVASAVVSAQAADANGDGKVDIILTGRHIIQILLGNGNGTFSAPVTLTLPSEINLGPQKPLIVDLNNDGGLDILLPDVLTHNVNVLLRNLVV